MNKSNIEAGQPGTTVDSNSTAQNQHVSQPNANTNVVGSREIKFRAWDYFNDVMVYDSDDETDFKFYNGKPLVKYVTEQHTVENSIDIDRPIWNQVDGPVMQYTGLKDKNGKGKDIYEADIFNNTNKTSVGIVSWNKDQWVIKFPTYQYSLSQFLENDETREVVGNIFENSELLQSA